MAGKSKITESYEKVRRNLERWHDIVVTGKYGKEDYPLFDNFCEYVFYTRFSTFTRHKDDLIQEGKYGILSLIDSGKYDPGRPVLNYLYTAVMGKMTVFTYHVMKNENRKDYTKTPDDADSFSTLLASDESDQLRLFIDKQLGRLDIDDMMLSYVRSYFYKKIGIDQEPVAIRTFSIDFVDKYRYYVNYIEYLLITEGMGDRVFQNSVYDILDVLEYEGEVSYIMREFLNSLSKDQLAKLLYIYSNSGFTVPSKHRLLKIDTYLSIYKRVAIAGMDRTDVSRMFDKSTITIDSVVDKYGKIYMEEHAENPYEDEGDEFDDSLFL